MNKINSNRTFSYIHNEHEVVATIWNESKENIEVLYDYHNVIDAYSLDTLKLAAGTQDKPYAIVSLLTSTGRNWESLKSRALLTGECIVALVVKNVKRKKRKETETSIKYRVMELLNWNIVECALDDKPWEWEGKRSCKEEEILKRDREHKKSVYLIKFKIL